MSLLADRVQDQTAKIAGLERVLAGRREELGRTEELVQAEILQRSSLETRKVIWYRPGSSGTWLHLRH